MHDRAQISQYEILISSVLISLDIKKSIIELCKSDDSIPCFQLRCLDKGIRLHGNISHK